MWYQLQGHLTKPAVLLPASSKLLIRIRNETAGGCRIMLPWKPLQVCGPRNNKPQIFRVCKKKKREKEERERKQTEINITNQRHCKHFWKENTIALLNVTCQAEHCRGQKNLAKKYTGVYQKKKKKGKKKTEPTNQTKNPQTLEGTETETKSIIGHWVQKKQQKEKTTSWKGWNS